MSRIDEIRATVREVQRDLLAQANSSTLPADLPPGTTTEDYNKTFYRALGRSDGLTEAAYALDAVLDAIDATSAATR